MHRRPISWLIFWSILLVAVIVRLSNWEFFVHNYTSHFNFIDTDCYYQLRRLVYFVANFPSTLQWDTLADWPQGARVDWPEGFLVFIGLPLKVLGLKTFTSLELGACALMILLGIFTTWVSFYVSKKIFKKEDDALLVFMITAVNFLLVRYSCLGQFDHHIFESLFPLLFFAGALRLAQKSEPQIFLFISILIFYSLTVSSSSLFAIATFFSAYAFIFGKKLWHRDFFLLLLIPASILIFAYTAWFQNIHGAWFSNDHPSLFQLFLVLIFGGLAALVVEARESKSRMAWGFLGVLVLSFFVCYFLNWPPKFMVRLTSAFEYVFGRAGILQSVSEADTIWMNFGVLDFGFAILNFGFLVFFLPLIWIFLPFVFLKNQRWSLNERIFFLFLGLLGIPGVIQKRFSQIFIAFVLIFYVWLLVKLREWLDRNQIRVVPMLTLLFVGLMVFPTLSGGFAPAGQTRDRIDHSIAAEFLNHTKFDSNEVWNRLAGTDLKNVQGIWTNPNLGHLLEYVTGLPVTSNSFYHPQSFQNDLRLRSIGSMDVLVEEVRKLNVRYLIVADDFRFFELEHRLAGLSSAKWFKEDVTPAGSRVTFEIPELQKFAWVRLVTDENPDPRFKMLFSSRTTEPYYYNFVRCFELARE